VDLRTYAPDALVLAVPGRRPVRRDGGRSRTDPRGGRRTPGKKSPAERTARIARTVLRGFSEYFDLPYPLPKLHFVALSDFWAGMENWGAISGGEDHYLLDETASPSGLEYGDQVITHEIAHQWFGDLVTLRTWDDLWLNEAFATFAVPVVQEQTGLRQDPWAEFVLRTQRAGGFDSLWSTHPVKPETCDPSEVMSNADEITYLKGSRLIRMIEAFVGRENFRAGLTQYLRDHQLSNARSDDLWSALEETSRQPVSKVMRTWVERPGHPCLTVRQKGPDVELSQRRFTFVPGDHPEAPWPIPLTWVDGTQRESIVFNSERMTLPGRQASKLQIDPGRTGFFPILWGSELREAVIAKLGYDSPLDRWGFVQDANGFLVSGDYSLDDYLAVLQAVNSVTDRLTVEGVARSLHILEPVLWDVPRFCDAARQFCRIQTDRLGESSSPGEPEAWDVVRDWTFWMRVRLDVGYARGIADRFDSIDREPPALRQAIATAFARQGPPDATDRLLARARGSNPDAATQACFALGDVSDPRNLSGALDEAQQSISMSSLLAYLSPSISRNPANRPQLWDWLTHHSHGLEQRAVGTSMMTLFFSRTLPTVGIGRAGALRAYFARETFTEGRLGVSQGMELLDAYERLRERAGAGPTP
jgi:tricorn protease interacting factor F2/3